MRVRIEGPEGAPVIILLHGFLYSLETWDVWADALSTDFRVVRYDLLGHGLTGPDAARRYAPMERAAFLGALMEAIGVDRAAIGGNSLGGLVAWRYASMAPERVSALVLVAPGGYSINGVEDEPAPAPAAMKLFLKTAPEAGVKTTLEALFEDDALVDERRIARLRDMMRREGNGEAFIQSIEEFTLPDPQADLARITAPTLILWGDKDMLMPVDHGRMMADAIPSSELTLYENVGHVPQEEAGAATAADVRRFLARVHETAR